MLLSNSSSSSSGSPKGFDTFSFTGESSGVPKGLLLTVETGATTFAPVFTPVFATVVGLVGVAFGEFAPADSDFEEGPNRLGDFLLK